MITVDLVFIRELSCGMLSCGSTQIQCGFHFAERPKVLIEHSCAMMTQVRAYVILSNTEDARKPRSVACVAWDAWVYFT